MIKVFCVMLPVPTVAYGVKDVFVEFIFSDAALSIEILNANSVLDVTGVGVGIGVVAGPYLRRMWDARSGLEALVG